MIFPREHSWRVFIILCLLGNSLIACGAVNNTDTVATLQADSVLYGTEVAQLQLAEAEFQGLVAETVVAAQTEVNAQNNVNRQLLETISAGSTPTIAVINSNAGSQAFIPQSTLAVASSGEQQFILTGTAMEVNPADGCAVSLRTEFSSDEDRVYATLRSFNVQPGTLMEVFWSREGVAVWEDSWVVDDNYANLCIWFFLQPSYVEFTIGSWSVQLFADGQPIGQPMTFTFEDM